MNKYLRWEYINIILWSIVFVINFFKIIDHSRSSDLLQWLWLAVSLINISISFDRIRKK